MSRYISTEEGKAGGAKRDGEILIQRKKNPTTTVPYRITDDPSKLTAQDWSEEKENRSSVRRFPFDFYSGTNVLSLSSRKVQRGSSKDGRGLEIQ